MTKIGGARDKGVVFSHILAPTITSFTPISGSTGTTATITGTSFTETTVKFGGTNAASFTVDSSTRITAVVSSGSTGNVTVTTDGGMAFWIITVYNNTIQLDGSFAPQTTYYEKTLGSGWNLFALPWSSSTNIDLDKIALSDGTNTYWITSASNTLTQQFVLGTTALMHS